MVWGKKALKSPKKKNQNEWEILSNHLTMIKEAVSW
jgi:hypothetical protein